MRKRISLIVTFYFFYFFWLLLVIHLWPNPEILSYFLLGIVVFYFALLREKGDVWLFALTVVLSWLTAQYFAADPTLVTRGVPPLGVPFWPITWGVTTVAFRKFYIVINKGAPEI